MPKRDQLLSQLQGEQDFGILLTAQMGGAPNELQLMIETAQYDEQSEGLRPRAGYIIRALGVREHQLHLGVFGTLGLGGEHPILYHHNTPRTVVAFEGQPDNLYELIVDISQTHASTFGPYRHIADDLNHAMPLVDLLQSGKGILGEMPLPLAERMKKALEHHKLRVELHEDQNFETEDEHGRSKLAKVLAIDNAYVVALDFSVEEVGKV